MLGLHSLYIKAGESRLGFFLHFLSVRPKIVYAANSNSSSFTIVSGLEKSPSNLVAQLESLKNSIRLSLSNSTMFYDSQLGS